jgi:putative ABC transport system ATP-binding protein
MLITLQAVTKSYPTAAGAFCALRDVDLSVRPGELLAIVGRSGCGKSTLLNLIGGIDSPTSGSVTVTGTALHELPPHRLAAWRGRNVGFVFQSFQLMPTLSAAENVILPMDFSGRLPASKRRARALELLERVAVADQADKLPSALSGGQQQRVALARALANDPSLLLADEPTGNLDAETADAMLGLFRTLASGGTTVLIATHEHGIARLADRTVELASGRLAEEVR